VESSPPAKSPPAPPKPEPLPAEKPATPAPAATKPAASKPEVPREPPPDPHAAHLAAIRDTLRRYTQAYQSLDSQAVASVMPSLTADQLRSLERDFANYRSYTVAISNERIVLGDGTATVTCQVERRFEARSGAGGSHTAETVFHFRRNGSTWTIERLELR
jgi:hypothetical protein